MRCPGLQMQREHHIRDVDRSIIVSHAYLFANIEVIHSYHIIYFVSSYTNDTHIGQQGQKPASFANVCRYSIEFQVQIGRTIIQIFQYTHQLLYYTLLHKIH